MDSELPIIEPRQYLPRLDQVARPSVRNRDIPIEGRDDHSPTRSLENPLGTDPIVAVREHEEDQQYRHDRQRQLPPEVSRSEHPFELTSSRIEDLAPERSILAAPEIQDRRDR